MTLHPRWKIGLCLTLAVGLTGLALLFRPLDAGDYFFAEVGRWIWHGRPVGPLVKETRAICRFEVQHDGLAGVQIQWATYARTNRSTLVLELREAGRRTPSRRIKVDAASLEDWGWQTWRFAPLSSSRGRTYELVCSSPDADENSALAFLASEPAPRTRTSLTFGGRDLTGATAHLRLLFTPWPRWWRSPSFWLAAGLGLVVLVVWAPLWLRLGLSGATKRLAFSLAPALILVLLLEAGLRLAGWPSGLFAGLCGGQETLGPYPPNAALRMPFGPIHYTVRTNSLGLRGREVPFQRRPETLRLAAIGDSFTDGFYVDNDQTYPQQLEDILNNQYRRRVEVLNLAKGGATIDRHLATLAKVALPLKPDLVILQFYPNDVIDLESAGPGEALEKANEKQPGGIDAPLKSLQCFLTKTALGEAGLDLFLKLRLKQYRAQERTSGGGAAGGDVVAEAKIRANLAALKTRGNLRDELIFQRPWPKEIKPLARKYLAYLREFAALARRNGMAVVFLFVPDYRQLYDPQASLEIRDFLAEACRAEGLPFLDPSPWLKTAGQRRSLHFAPVDYHFNALGNRLLAEAVAEFLVRNGLVG